MDIYIDKMDRWQFKIIILFIIVTPFGVSTDKMV